MLSPCAGTHGPNETMDGVLGDLLNLEQCITDPPPNQSMLNNVTGSIMFYMDSQVHPEHMSVTCSHGEIHRASVIGLSILVFSALSTGPTAGHRTLRQLS